VEGGKGDRGGRGEWKGNERGWGKGERGREGMKGRGEGKGRGTRTPSKKFGYGPEAVLGRKFSRQKLAQKWRFLKN